MAQQVIDDRGRAHAAADLDFHGRLRGEACDNAAIGEGAVARAVQIVGTLASLSAATHQRSPLS